MLISYIIQNTDKAHISNKNSFYHHLAPVTCFCIHHWGFISICSLHNRETIPKYPIQNNPEAHIL